MDAFEKCGDARGGVFSRGCRRGRIQFAQIPASGENRLLRTRKDADGSVGRERAECGNEFFQLHEHSRADFVGGSMIERQLDHAVAPFPTPRFTGTLFHASVLLAASRAPFDSYIALISEAYSA